MNRPVSAVGLLIMIMAVVVGFIPTLPSILLLFATTLLGGHYIKKNTDQKTYDYFVRVFGHMVIIFNLVFIGMVSFTPLNPIDKFSAMFLNVLVVIVMVTFLKISKKEK